MPIKKRLETRKPSVKYPGLSISTKTILMNNISDSDIQKIIELSVNIGANYLKWAGLCDELTTKQFREEFDCCDELIKVLDGFDPDGDKKLDSNRLVVITHGYLSENFSKNHANLYRIGFSVAQQTLGLAARHSSADEEDSGKSIADMLPEHMKNLKDRLDGVLPPRITKAVLELTTNKIEEEGFGLDIDDLLVQVFNKVAFPGERKKVTVKIGEEEKTYQTFTEIIGGILNYGVEKFTKKCTSLGDLNNKEKFREIIEAVSNDFLRENKDILNGHMDDFIEELYRGGQVDMKQPLPSVDGLVLGAIGGMAEGFWLNHKKQNDSPN